MGKRSRDKGARFERAIVNALRESGLASERVPLSGAAGGSYAGDVTVDFGMGKKTLEAKARANGFQQIYQWLGLNFGLVIRADRSEPLLVLRLSDAAEIAAMLQKERQDAAIRDNSAKP